MNQTKHQIFVGAAQKMEQIQDNSIALVVTSPPYPMIEMWDDIFAKQNDKIKSALIGNDGLLAFNLMHEELDSVWSEVKRVLMPGGIACINIGDATRTINGEFALYPNHSRIISAFQKLGIPNLPNIIWRKQTNAPNKFMGSGMLPAGAYVTLEHEWILIFRKEGKRQFKTESEKFRRKESSFFWEERNVWFSDLWDLKGVKQKIETQNTRNRSAAFPFEIPYRLINMYSLQDDIILDPFLGIGTTTIAAIASKRNSIGFEIDPLLLDAIIDNFESVTIDSLNSRINDRIKMHKLFIETRDADPDKDEFKHYNHHLRMPVMTSQETEIKLSYLENLERNKDVIIANYGPEIPREPILVKRKAKKVGKTLFDFK